MHKNFHNPSILVYHYNQLLHFDLQYPESTDITEKGPFVISNTTQKVDMRARGRQGRIRVSCDSTGTKWRWASLRLAVQPDGGR